MKNQKLIERKNSKLAMYFLLPAIMMLVFVFLIPIIMALYISFLKLDIFNFSKFTSAPFAGLFNYLELFSDRFDIGKTFLKSLRNIFVFGVLVVSISYIIALGVSVFLNRKFIGKGILIALILLPYFSMDSVIYGVWAFMFQTDYGIINGILYKIGIINKPIVWLVGQMQFIPVVIATIWKTWPFMAFILYAGLQGIHPELYEAASIDGANSIQKFFKITIPLLLPITSTLLLIESIWMVHSYNNFAVMLNGGAAVVNDTIIPSIFISNILTGNINFGLGSAVSIVLMIIILILTYFLILNRKGQANE